MIERVELPAGIPDDIEMSTGCLADLAAGTPGASSTAGANSAWEQILTSEEHERRASFKNEARRCLFTLGRVVLRRHLGDRLGMAPCDVPIRILESGPLVLGLTVEPGSAVKRTGGVPRNAESNPSSSDPVDPSLIISLAHSGERAIAASAHRPVGVDIEIMKPRTDRLLNYITHPDERGHLRMLAPTQHEQLHAVWTIKEAVLKALGTGLRTGPRKLRISQPSILAPNNPAPTALRDWHCVRVMDMNQNAWDAAFAFEGSYATALSWQL